MSPIKILICFNIPCNYAITFFPHDRDFKIHILPNKVTSYQNYGLFLERGQTSPCIVDGQDNEQSSPTKKKVSVSLVTLNAPYPTHPLQLQLIPTPRVAILLSFHCCRQQ